MEDNDPLYATQEWVAALVQVVDRNNKHAISMLEQQLETLARQNAELTMAFATSASILQAFMATKLDDIDREAFMEHMKIAGQDKLKAFKDGISQANSTQPRFHPSGEPDTDQPDSED